MSRILFEDTEQDCYRQIAARIRAAEDNVPSMLLGEMLVRRGLITPAQLEVALLRQQQRGGHVGSILVRMGAITAEQLLTALPAQRENAVIEQEGALERSQAQHGSAHESTSRAHYDLAHALLEVGRAAEAAPHAEAAFDGFATKRGRHHRWSLQAARLVTDARQAVRAARQRQGHHI
jgi:hypothetical protein